MVHFPLPCLSTGGYALSRFQWDLLREMIEDIEGDSFWQSGIDMENH